MQDMMHILERMHGQDTSARIKTWLLGNCYSSNVARYAKYIPLWPTGVRPHCRKYLIVSSRRHAPNEKENVKSITGNSQRRCSSEESERVLVHLRRSLYANHPEYRDFQKSPGALREQCLTAYVMII